MWPARVNGLDPALAQGVAISESPSQWVADGTALSLTSLALGDSESATRALRSWLEWETLASFGCIRAENLDELRRHEAGWEAT